ncbi:L-lactate dehydrogenase [Thalassospira marina]|uniref:L-lactate dehydrogenase n=1 Tax=Thalassospira marina TaxID=2048283 RepID=A0A2N3KR40_9PROT|nr:L-lactate dehydrogenase [Thalassospira marina]AUG55501.1 L-lactate dehydrogenase [Thalassospira marina]PKR53005.1 L-lactate dehydrogenase [Thalassospira marina]
MKIGIVGAGMVGSSAGYAIALMGIASSVIFVDRNADLARAQAEDISHAVPFMSSCVVQAGDYADLKGASVVILAAGVSQKPGETRLELLGRNAAVFREVVGEVLRVAPDAILLIASNPVDIMTQITARLSGLPAERVIGSGTILDTARFRSLLGRHLQISPQSVHAYVLGEHGDSEVLAWSNARAGSEPLLSFATQLGAPLTGAIKAEIDDGVRNAAYKIINGKGATYYGIGAGLARIVKSIAQDQQDVLSVSIVTRHVAGIEDVALSIPRVVGAAGICADMMPTLDDGENEALHRSASMLKTTIEAVEL